MLFPHYDINYGLLQTELCCKMSTTSKTITEIKSPENDQYYTILQHNDSTAEHHVMKASLH